MQTFRDVIDHIGIKPLAQALGLRDSHVRVMRTRGSIPADYWATIAGMGVPDLTFERLAQMRAAAFGRRRDEMEMRQ